MMEPVMIAMTELERSDLFQRTNQNVRSHQIRKKKNHLVSCLVCTKQAEPIGGERETAKIVSFL